MVGHNNKYNCHKFAPGQPRGLLSKTKFVDSEGAFVLTSRFICPSYVCFAGTEPFPCCYSIAKIVCCLGLRPLFHSFCKCPNEMLKETSLSKPKAPAEGAQQDHIPFRMDQHVPTPQWTSAAGWVRRVSASLQGCSHPLYGMKPGEVDEPRP